MFPRKITSKWLDKQGACGRGRDAFERVFPDGAVLTKANFQKAIDNDLDIRWLTGLLPYRSQAAINKQLDPHRTRYFDGDLTYAEYAVKSLDEIVRYILRTTRASAKRKRATASSRSSGTPKKSTKPRTAMARKRTLNVH